MCCENNRCEHRITGTLVWRYDHEGNHLENWGHCNGALRSPCADSMLVRLLQFGWLFVHAQDNGNIRAACSFTPSVKHTETDGDAQTVKHTETLAEAGGHSEAQ